MRRDSVLAFLMANLLIPALLVCGAEPDQPSLQVGSMFPQFSGQTLTGKSLELPRATIGRPAVVVFSFSKAAGKDSHQWNDHLSRDFPNVPSYTVIELEAVPKLFRRMVLSGIKSSMPVPIQDRAIVLYQDESLWKQRLAVSDDSRAYVVLLEPDGHIRWSSSGKFAELEYAGLRNVLGMLSQQHP
jgi:ATP10 protein